MNYRQCCSKKNSGDYQYIRKKNKSIKFHETHVWAFYLMLITMWGLTIGVFILGLLHGFEGTFWLFFLIFVSISTFITLAIGYYCFTFCTLSETGVKRALFGKFRKKELKWEEIVEIKVISFISREAYGSVVFSKIPLDDYHYSNVSKTNKHTIHIPFSSKLIREIRKYTNQPITNLPESEVEKIINSIKK